MSKGMKWVVGLSALVILGSISSSRTDNNAPLPMAPPRPPSSGPATFTDSALVWVSRSAMDRGGELLRSRAYEANPQLLLPLVACIVPPGTAATVIAAAGMGVREVAVDAGPHRGCTGFVPMERIGSR